MLGRIVFAVFVVLYPAVVWLCMKYGEPAWVAGLLAVMAVTQALQKKSAMTTIVALFALGLAGAAFCLESFLPVKFYPVAVNAAWFAFFAGSLASTPAAERFARMRHTELPDYAVRYCRQVTVAWSVFFLANGLVALDSALYRSDDWWALYNGLIAYVLIGMMFAVEYGVRAWVDRLNRENE